MMELFGCCENSARNNCKMSDESNCKRNCCGLVRPKRGIVENNIRNVKPRIGHQKHKTVDSECSNDELNVLEENSEFLPSVSLADQARSLDEVYAADSCSEPEKTRSDNDDFFDSVFCTNLPSARLHINTLPHWILVHIFCQLSLAERLLRAALVCRYWNQLSQDPDLWREIDFRGRTKVNDEVLARVVCFSKRVVSVDLTDCRNVTNVGMENVLSVCKDIQKLTLVRCQHLTGRTFKCISETSRHLQELNLSCCFALDDTSLISIGTGCRSLKDLKLNQCSKVTDHGITEMVKLCSTLVALSVDQCTRLKGAWVEVLVNSCHQMKFLSCKECPMTYENVKLLSKLSHLTHLEISNNSNVNDNIVISLIRGCQQLECLNLSLCNLVTNEAVAHLAKYGRRLQSLHLVSCAIDNKALESLAECPALQTLDIAYCGQVTFDGVDLVSSRCKNLRYLGLMRCDHITHKEAETLAEKYPQIHISTLWLDCQRVIEKAQRQGFVFPVSRHFCDDQQTSNQLNE